MATHTAALELRRINKHFGPVHANKDVSFSAAPGTIHGIIGENGAGKSTLMSIVYGYYSADGGEILVDGRPLSIDSPDDAIAAGIGMVHQHFMLVDTFTALENILLGVEGGALLARGKARAAEELRRLEKEYMLEVDVHAIVGDLPVGLRQRVEILKALYRGADILILDEPTGVLTPQEADHLFRILEVLRAQGKTVILITHKLREIMAITDEVTVMRQGAVVATVKTADTSREKLAEMMVGRPVLLSVEKDKATPGETLLEAENVSLIDESGIKRLGGIGLQLRAGEILGIAGVSGNGQSELLEVLAGMAAPSSGRLIYKGDEIARAGHTPGPREMRRMGLAHVPEDRQRAGMVMSMPATECTLLGYQDDARYNRGLWLDRPAIAAECARHMAEYDVRPPAPDLKSSGFSGGNQQKLVLAREMERDPDVLLVGQPTRGVDIGAIEFIHNRLVKMRDRGKAVLLVSVELDEILSLADRILVMFDGHIIGEVSGDEADERMLGLMMAGERMGEKVA